jgi:hypothetical protein
MSGWPTAEEHTYGKTTAAPPPPEGWPRGVPYNPQSVSAKPTLTGHRNASRKRSNDSQKKRAEPAEFVAQLADLCNPNVDDKDQCFKLIQAQNFDFNTYGETFWEAIITGGIIQAGGSMDESVATPCALNVFDSPMDSIGEISNLSKNVMQRHRHLRPVLDTVLCRISLWVDRFNDDRQDKLAHFITTHCLDHSAGLQTVAKLQQEKRLIESGVALSFSCRIFREFLSRSTVEKLNRALKEGKCDKMIKLLPTSKQTPNNLFEKLEEYGLPQLAKWQKSHTADARFQEMQEKLDEELQDIQSFEDTNRRIEQLKKQYVLTDDIVVVAVFRCIMEIADLTSKKTRPQEMTKHLMSFVELIEPQCKTVSAEKKLIEAMLNYIQDDLSLTDAFMITCKELYDADALGEDSIIAWVRHKESQNDPDMEPFLKQMAPFVEWLEEADSDDSDE